MTNPPSISFDANAVYSLDALEAMLRPHVSAKQFLATLGVPRRFKYLVLGADIVRALEHPPAPNPEPAAAVIRTGKRGRPRKVRPHERVQVREPLDATGRDGIIQPCTPRNQDTLRTGFESVPGAGRVVPR